MKIYTFKYFVLWLLCHCAEAHATHHNFSLSLSLSSIDTRHTQPSIPAFATVSNFKKNNPILVDRWFSLYSWSDACVSPSFICIQNSELPPCVANWKPNVRMQNRVMRMFFFSVTAALLQSPLINSAERKKMSIWGVQNDTFMRTMCQLCTHISHAPPTQHTVLFASPVPHTDLWLFAYILFLFGVLGSVLASSPMWPFRYELTTFLNVHICHAVNHKQMRFPYFT